MCLAMILRMVSTHRQCTNLYYYYCCYCYYYYYYFHYYYLLPITYYLPTYYLLPPAYCLLPTTWGRQLLVCYCHQLLPLLPPAAATTATAAPFHMHVHDPSSYVPLISVHWTLDTVHVH